MDTYDLVFEGGGAKGVIFTGAMEVLLERGDNFDRLLGTSAGAITACFLSVGYSPQEMLAAIIERDENNQPVFSSFLGTPAPFSEAEMENSAIRNLLTDVDVPYVPDFIETRLDNFIASTLLTYGRYPNLSSFIERGGWYSADNFIAWLKRKMDEGEFQGKKRNFSEMTLKERFDATGRELAVVATDITGEKMLVLNHRTAPDLPLVWAVRMSMSIPLLWPAVEWQTEWGTYNGQDLTGHMIVDGGVLSNFPIELYVSDAIYVTDVMGPKRTDTKVLGMLIDEHAPVPDMPADPNVSAAGGGLGASVSKIETVQRILELVNTMLKAHDKMVIEAFSDRVMRLPAAGYGTIEFDMTDARRDALLNAGRDVARDFFAKVGRRSLAPEMTPEQQADDMAAKMLGM